MTSLDRIQMVFSRRPDGVSEDDWNTWYDAHLHEILAIPGFVSAQRFAIDQQVGAGEGPEWTHIALYEVEGDFEELAQNMIRMSLGSAESYIELKQTDNSGSAAAAVVGRRALRLVERRVARRPHPRIGLSQRHQTERPPSTAQRRAGDERRLVAREVEHGRGHLLGAPDARRIGADSSCAARAASSSPIASSTIGVSITPGCTTLTRMPSGASSTATVRVSAVSAPLAAVYEADSP